MADDLKRKTFPILNGDGARIDYQLVADHGEQAQRNHYQSVDRLAEGGGLSWEELFAVLNNQRFQRIDKNEAIIACRAIEACYLAALGVAVAPDITALQAQNRKLVEALTPSGDTKAAYMGEFSFLAISTDGDGNETAVKTYVPWTTIKEIMAAIRARAAIAEAEKGDG